jgi:PKD repeat protein
MFSLKKWVRKWQAGVSRLRPGSDQSPRRAVKRRGRVLNLESLDSRILPSSTPLYTTAEGGTALMSIDATTGVGTRIGSFGFSDTWTGAFTPDGTYWTIVRSASGPQGQLARVNLTTGQATPVGSPHGRNDWIISLESDASGNLFAGGHSGAFYQVNKTTGQMTQVGAGIYTCDFTFDNSGNLWAVDGSFNLYKLNSSTGALQSTVTMTGLNDGTMSVMVDPADNQMYVATQSSPGRLYKVNPTTGATTLVGSNLGVNFPHGGDFLPTAPSVQAVGVSIDDAGSRLLIFDPTTGTQTGLVSIPTGGETLDAVVSPDGKFAYVSDFGNQRVWIVDLTTKALASGVNVISVPTFAEDMVITSDGKFLLVVDGGGGGSPIVVVNTATRAVASTFNTGGDNVGVEVTQNGDVLVGVGFSQVRRFTLSATGTLTYTGQVLFNNYFNTTAAPNGVFAVTTNAGNAIASFAISGMAQVSGVSVPEAVVNMAFSADGSKLYVRGTNRVFAYNYNPTTGAIGSQVFASNTLAEAILFYGVDQLDVIGNRVYTQSGGGVVALDATTGAVLGTITVSGASFVGVDLAGVANRAPTAEAGGPYTVAEGGSITLNGSGSDPDGDGLTYQWDLDNNGTFETTGQSPTFSAANFDGFTSRTVALRVIDSKGAVSATDTATVNINNVAPTATGINGPTSLNEGQSGTYSLANVFDPSPADAASLRYSFALSSSGLAASYGAAGTTNSFTNLFTENGTYIVWGRVFDNDGGSNTYSTTVTVTNVAPTANAGADQTVNEGDTVNLSGTFSDPGAADTHTQTWSVVASNGQVIADGSGSSFSFTPNDNGTYTVTYKVEDDDGDVGTDTAIITVDNVAPKAVIVGAPASSPEGTTINLLSTVGDPGTADTHTYNWSVTKNGSAYTSGTSEYFSFTPDDNGKYVVTLVVIDDDGGEGAAEVTIDVTNVDPQKVFAGKDQKVDEGTLVTLEGSFFDPGKADTHTQTWSVVASNGQVVADGSGETFSFTPNDNGTYTVTFKVVDDDKGVGSAEVVIFVNNVAPTVAIGGVPKSSPEGTTITLDSKVTDPGTADTHTLEWFIAKNGVLYATGTGPAITFTPDDNGTYEVKLVATDDDKGVGTAVTKFGVTNVDPTAAITGAPTSSPEGTAISLGSTVSDPGTADTHTFAWSVTKNGNAYASGTDASFSFTPDDNGTYVVTLTVTDDDGGVGCDNESINVTNVAPTAVLANSGTVDEGGTVTFTATATDPAGAADPLTYEFDFNNDGTFEVNNGSSNVANFLFPDSGTYAVNVRVSDGDGGQTVASTTVIINNVAPTVGAITAPIAPVAVSTAISTSAAFADVGVNDTHTATWAWGDGSTSAGTVTESGGSGSVAGSHTYATPGVYTVTLTVTDKDGASVTTIFQYVVVYDAADGFVTGGGWINSPAGAYVANPSLTGKANFGFVSKYQRGTTTPTGQTEFQFKAGSFNFHSSSYEWLVVAGARAIYKGTGTVNGSGSYGFQLTAIDGQVSGGGGVDKFRIKVWDKTNNDAIVYDNQMGAANDADPTTALGGGSIVIHTTGSPLMAAGGAADGGTVPVLTEAELRPIIAEAIRRWAAAGLDADRLAALGAVEVRTADLSGAYLGLAFAGENTVRIDTDAAGYGWFVDSTPWEDSEFSLPGDQGEQGRMDLLSTVTHELGHMLGLDDLHGDAHADDLMGEELAAGSRRVPTAEEAAEVTGDVTTTHEAPAAGTVTLTTTQPAAGTVTLTSTPVLLWLAPATATPAIPQSSSDPAPAERTAPAVALPPDLRASANQEPAAGEWLLPPHTGGETVAESLWDIDLREEN